MKLLILLFLTNIAHATYDPSLQNLQLDMMYSAKISSAGVVSDENKDWINGNCAVTATNHFDCTYNTAIFTVAPNCIIKDQAVAQTGGFSVLFDNSSSSATHAVYNTYSGVALPYGADPRAVNIVCQKQGVDYLTASSAVYSVQNQDTDWVSYSPSVSSVGVATNLGKWRRQGDTLEVEGQITFNAGGSASTLTIGMPSGLTIDSTKITSSSTGTVGSGYWSDSGVGFFLLNVRPDTSSTIAFYQQAGTASFNSSVIATGDVVTFNFKVPVTGWKTAPFAIASYLGVGVLYTGAPATGTLNSSYNTVTFGTKVFDSATSSYSGGTYTVPVNGLYDISAQVQVNSTLTVGQSVLLGIHVDGVLKYAVNASAHGSITNINPSVKASSIPLLAGQLVTIKCLTEGATNSYSSTAGYSFLSITRTGSY